MLKTGIVDYGRKEFCARVCCIKVKQLKSTTKNSFYIPSVYACVAVVHISEPPLGGFGGSCERLLFNKHTLQT